MNWEQVGVVGVDAGLLWVGDPCYCVTPDCSDHPAKSWDDFCEKLKKIERKDIRVAQWNYKKGHDGLGISVSTGYGDGSYPVYVKRNKENRIKEVKVVFIEDK